jgi:hypothetical protein
VGSWVLSIRVVKNLLIELAVFVFLLDGILRLEDL